jgi:hypothetical protein
MQGDPGIYEAFLSEYLAGLNNTVVFRKSQTRVFTLYIVLTMAISILC